MTVSTVPNHRGQAILAIIVAVASLSLGDALIKATGLLLPLWQMLVLRSSFVVPVLWWLARRRGSTISSNIGWVIVRSILLVCMWLSYYSALSLMPFSLAAAVYYTGPLLIVALATLLARRQPSIRTIAAISGGFIGVLLVIRPDTSGITTATLLPFIAAVLYACAMVLTSAKCRDVDPVVLTMALNLTFIVSGAVLGLFADREGSFILGHWQTLDLRLLVTVAALAILILIGNIGAAIAYQKGPPATVAAFDYSYLIFSLIWGSLFFSELPGILGIIGIAIIAASGLLASSGQKG